MSDEQNNLNHAAATLTEIMNMPFRPRRIERKPKRDGTMQKTELHGDDKDERRLDE